jgi:hypothetical protein
MEHNDIFQFDESIILTRNLFYQVTNKSPVAVFANFDWTVQLYLFLLIFSFIYADNIFFMSRIPFPSWQIALGLVVALNYQNPFMNPYEEFQVKFFSLLGMFKAHN